MRTKLRLALAGLLLAAALFSASNATGQATPALTFTAANLTLPAASSSIPAGTLLDPEAQAWQQSALRRVALNRTPPLYDTDPPATLDISVVEVRLARVAGGKLLVHLRWRDPTNDVAAVAATPETPPEQRQRKEPTAATERFFDAAAVMFPANRVRALFTPSLQMGDPDQPVSIYYWNAARGALLMEAQGRGTTRRTDKSFPARGAHRAGGWRVVLELPDLPAGVPLSFAVWNGSQQDRDGRKYFSVWHWLE
jgi:complex iron-sulfur molybdoenzyme family reductase subunit gamma